MSAVKQAAANTVLRIANLFEQNCALKHGLPKVGGPDRVGADEQPTPPAVVNITNEIPAATAANESPSPLGATEAVAAAGSLAGRAAPWLVAAALGGGGLAGYGINALLRDDPSPKVVATPPIVAPTAPPAAPLDGSLLQWLEDQGHHLPGGESWTK